MRDFMVEKIKKWNICNNVRIITCCLCKTNSSSSPHDLTSSRMEARFNELLLRLQRAGFMK